MFFGMLLEQLETMKASKLYLLEFTGHYGGIRNHSPRTNYVKEQGGYLLKT